MGPKKRRVGRPAAKKLTPLGKWAVANGWSREQLADELKTPRQNVDRFCRGDRRPSLELCLRIEKLTGGEVPVSSWLKVRRQPD